MNSYTPHIAIKTTILLPNINDGVFSTLVESDFGFNVNFNFNFTLTKMIQI
jgi:hypothetical protein